MSNPIKCMGVVTNCITTGQNNCAAMSAVVCGTPKDLCISWAKGSGMLNDAPIVTKSREKKKR